MTTCAEDRYLLEQLAELDRGIADSVSEPGSFVAPPPLVDVLVIPQPRGRWRQTCQGDPSGYLIAGAPSDPKLEDLDQGLVQSPDSADSVPPPGSWKARPLLPERRGTLREVVRNRPARSFSSEAPSGWMVSACLILLMFTGAAGAALAFHERLSAVVIQLEGRLK